MTSKPSVFERNWITVIITPVTIANYVVTVADTTGLKVKQKISLLKTGLDTLELEIKRVLSDTQFQIGPIGPSMTAYSNPVTYSGGTIQMQEQQRNLMGSDIYMRAAFDEEPTLALRNVLVDKFGQYYTTDHPLPVQLSDGSVNIGTVNAELEVQLSHKDNYFHPGDIHDSVRIGDGVTEAKIDPLNQSFSTNRYEKLIGLLANANWMKLGNFDTINPIFAGNLATLEYKESGNVIGRAFFTFVTDSNWNITTERYINDDDGTQLLAEDGSYLFLD